MKINYDDVGAGGVGTTGGVVVVVVVGVVVVGAVDVVVGAVDVVVGATDVVAVEAVGTTGGAGAGVCVSCFFCNAF